MEGSLQQVTLQTGTDLLCLHSSFLYFAQISASIDGWFASLCSSFYIFPGLLGDEDHHYCFKQPHFLKTAIEFKIKNLNLIYMSTRTFAVSHQHCMSGQKPRRDQRTDWSDKKFLSQDQVLVWPETHHPLYCSFRRPAERRKPASERRDRRPGSWFTFQYNSDLKRTGHMLHIQRWSKTGSVRGEKLLEKVQSCNCCQTISLVVLQSAELRVWIQPQSQKCWDTV